MSLIPVIIIINLFFYVISGLFSAYSITKEVSIHYQEVVKARAQLLIEPLWNLEFKRAETLIKELIIDERIAEVRLYEGGKLIKHLKNTQLSSDIIHQVKVPIIFEQDTVRRHIGDLQVKYSTDIAYETFIEKIIEGVLLSILLSLIVSYCIFQVTFRKVIRPLNILTKTIKKSEADNKRYSVDWESNCEFGIVAKSFNSMQQHLENEEEKLKIANKKLDYIAYNDALTGLANRTCWNYDIKNKYECVNPDKKFAIIHLDLDNFKHVNDTLGHSVGDHLLVEIGHRLKLILQDRDNSKVYRWGGDEFIIYFDMNDGDLEEFCSEITDLLSVPLPFKSTILLPSCSVGVACFPDDGTDINSLMIYSDIALYKSKEKGRDNYIFITKDMKNKLHDESEMEHELYRALDGEELFVAYQPQIDIQTFAVTGLEALIRWQHPSKGLLAPSEFLHLTENNKIAIKLSQYILNHVFKDMRNWLDNNVDFSRVSINLSPKHIEYGNALDDFKRVISEYNIDTKYITAEVLENLFIDDPKSRNVEFIQELYDLGINVELDDFGTGYASLSHISALPINGIKLDRTFIMKMLLDKRKSIVIKSLFSMSKLLGMRLICEGVETAEQMDYLKEMGQCSVQGYYIGKPMPSDEITTWLKEEKNLKNHITHNCSQKKTAIDCIR